MRNQFSSVTPTYRSEIIIKSNWYTLLNILVFDLGSIELPRIRSLVTNRLEIWRSVFINVSLFSRDFFKRQPYGEKCGIIYECQCQCLLKLIFDCTMIQVVAVAIRNTVTSSSVSIFSYSCLHCANILKEDHFRDYSALMCCLKLSRCTHMPKTLSLAL